MATSKVWKRLLPGRRRWSATFWRTLQRLRSESRLPRSRTRRPSRTRLFAESFMFRAARAVISLSLERESSELERLLLRREDRSDDELSREEPLSAGGGGSEEPIGS